MKLIEYNLTTDMIVDSLIKGIFPVVAILSPINTIKAGSIVDLLSATNDISEGDYAK